MFSYLSACFGSLCGLGFGLYLTDGQGLGVVCTTVCLGGITGYSAGDALDRFLIDLEESSKKEV